MSTPWPRTAQSKPPSPPARFPSSPATPTCGARSPTARTAASSTTYLDDTVARFPDAVTARGLKHLTELTKLSLAGTRAVCFFLVTREDAQSFGPAPEIDPAWAAAYEEARAAGVEVIAYDARINAGDLVLGVSLAIQAPA
jgi:sugar fermentation stimulation protein A